MLLFVKINHLTPVRLPIIKKSTGASLVVQWLRLPTNAGDTGSILGPGTRNSHAMGQLSPRTTTTEPLL